MSTLTLYDIETELFHLMLAREAVLNDPDRGGVLDDGVTVEKELEEIDLAIRERVSAEIAKVDGIAYYLREFAARAATAKAEKKRLADREAMWERREERLKEIVTQVMLMTGKTRLEGDSNTLQLVKNPPSVEILQPELVPSEYQKVFLTMPRALWARVVRMLAGVDALLGTYNSQTGALPTEVLVEIGQHSIETAQPMKIPIGEALKRGDGVPGCALVRDKMRLNVE